MSLCLLQVAAFIAVRTLTLASNAFHSPISSTKDYIYYVCIIFGSTVCQVTLMIT